MTTALIRIFWYDCGCGRPGSIYRAVDGTPCPACGQPAWPVEEYPNLETRWRIDLLNSLYDARSERGGEINRVRILSGSGRRRQNMPCEHPETEHLEPWRLVSVDRGPWIEVGELGACTAEEEIEIPAWDGDVVRVRRKICST